MAAVQCRRRGRKTTFATPVDEQLGRSCSSTTQPRRQSSHTLAQHQPLTPLISLLPFRLQLSLLFPFLCVAMVYPASYTRLEGNRRGNFDADIDEALFGNTGHARTQAQTHRLQHQNPSSSPSNRQRSSASTQATAVVKGSKLLSLTIASKDASTVTPTDFARIHALVHPPTVSSTQFPTSSALDRKQRILNTKVADAIGRGDSFDEEDSHSRLSALGSAKAALEEEHDEVKRMNQLMLYAQCVTVRDAQLEDKRRRVEEEKVQEQLIDQQMEAQRVRELQAEQRREETKERERREGAATLVVQIAERERERLREEEARELEARMMVEAIERRAKEEEERRLDKIERGKALMAEVTASNFAQTLEKGKKKEAEAVEERKRLRYLQEKEERERVREEEEAKVRREKEEEIARLRAQQEKAQDRQAAIDELRARRYQQEKDRQWRAEVASKAAVRGEQVKEVEAVRRAQKEEKEARGEKERAQEKAELERIQRAQRTQSQKEEEAEVRKEEERRLHAEQVREQMKRKEEERAKAREEYLKDGRSAEQRRAHEKARLEVIRAEKVQALHKMGVPDKYAHELKQKKILSDKIAWTSQPPRK